MNILISLPLFSYYGFLEVGQWSPKIRKLFKFFQTGCANLCFNIITQLLTRIIIIIITNLNNWTSENGILLLFYFAFLWLMVKLNIFSYVSHLYVLFCECSLPVFFCWDVSLFFL